MKEISRRKLLAALVTSLNTGFIFVLFSESKNEVIDTSIFKFYSEIIIFSVNITLLFAAPIAFLVGIPTSIGINKLTSTIQNTNFRNVIRCILYPLFGILIILLISILVGGGFPDFANKDVIISFILIAVYPSIVFWLMDTLLK